MPGDSFLDYDNKGIGELLRTELLAVPMYQRSYSWRSAEEALRDQDDDRDTKAEVSEYWDDLYRGFAEARPYFLGTVVLSTEQAMPGRKAVIDGQQRLATTCLLLAAIRDAYRARDEPEFADSIHRDFVARFDRESGSAQANLILNSDDRDYFHRVIVAGETAVAATTESQRLLAAAWRYLGARVADLCAESGLQWKSRLDDLVRYFDSSAQLIVITVATDADAFLIFETLNDRGADLTIADLLKNFLFSRSGPRLDEVRDSWVVALSNLDTPRAGNKRFNLFARHYMSSKRGPVRERDLFRRIKEEVSSPSSAVSFTTDLQKNSRLYYALLSVDSDVWSQYSESARQAAEVLVDLNLEQYRPLLLAALATFPKREIERLVPALVAWAIRGLAAGNLGGGVAEAAFCGAAKDIRERKIKSVADVLSDSRIDALIPSDKLFESAFSEWRVTRGSLARYILRALELQQRGDTSPELVVNPDVEKVNLEHILPQSPKTNEWSAFTNDERKLYVSRIGNCALLQKGRNGRIGNKPWAAKKPVLAESALALTKSVADNADWTAKEIATRQRVLAALAVDAWPRSPRT